MKILCLHGKGTSASILKAQTAAFRRYLHTISPETPLVFDFIDGPLASDPAPSIFQFFAGPFYSFYNSSSIEDLYSAQLWLLKVLETQGPYDGVLAFSQGCALIATLMLEIQTTSVTSGAKAAKQPFNFAIFICGGIPLAYLAEKGYTISDAAWEYDEQARLALASQASLDSLLQNGSQRWSHQIPPSLTNSHHHPSSNPPSNTPDETIFNLDIFQIPDSLKIQIPTVHVYGTRDPRMGSASQLAGMCRSDKARGVGHGGGHEIPRTSETSELIARLILWVVGEGRVGED